MELQYRLATEKDAQAIAALVNSAYRGDSSKQGWTTEADLLGGQRTDREAISETIQKANNVFLLCFQNEDLLGSVHLVQQNENCYLGMFTVQPTLQGSGIGKQFIQAAEDFARKEWNSKSVSMSVIVQRTELISWYERRGYAKTGKTFPFPYGDERFGIPKRDDLSMIELKKIFYC